MRGRKYYLYQVRASIIDNNPSVDNNSSQQARMEYFHMIQLDRNTTQSTVDLKMEML